MSANGGPWRGNRWDATRGHEGSFKRRGDGRSGSRGGYSGGEVAHAPSRGRGGGYRGGPRQFGGRARGAPPHPPAPISSRSPAQSSSLHVEAAYTTSNQGDAEADFLSVFTSSSELSSTCKSLIEEVATKREVLRGVCRRLGGSDVGDGQAADALEQFPLLPNGSMEACGLMTVPVAPYRRAAAGKVLVGSDLRTVLTLEKSMHFLVEHYLRHPEPYHLWHVLAGSKEDRLWSFLWDRFRGIRTSWIPQLPPAGAYLAGHAGAPSRYIDTEMKSTVSEVQLEKENRRRMRWLEFTVAALYFGAASMCRTVEGCKEFLEQKKNFLESISQCFTDLTVWYRTQQHRYRHAEMFSVLLLIYGLQQEAKVENRSSFCQYQTFSTLSTESEEVFYCPEEPAKSINLSQVYSELKRQPQMIRTRPVQSVLRLLHCWETRHYFEFLALCRHDGARKVAGGDEEETMSFLTIPLPLTPLQRAVVFQSFTYVRFRAVLDLLQPNYSVYQRLRLFDFIPLCTLSYLLLMEEDHCRRFLEALGVEELIELRSEVSPRCLVFTDESGRRRYLSSLSPGEQEEAYLSLCERYGGGILVLRLTNERGEPLISSEELQQRCSTKAALFLPTYADFFGFAPYLGADSSEGSASPPPASAESCKASPNEPEEEDIDMGGFGGEEEDYNAFTEQGEESDMSRVPEEGDQSCLELAPVDWMVHLEPYCPPYTDLLEQYPLEDVEEERWFGKIRFHRREALTRHVAQKYSADGFSEADRVGALDRLERESQCTASSIFDASELIEADPFGDSGRGMEEEEGTVQDGEDAEQPAHAEGEREALDPPSLQCLASADLLLEYFHQNPLYAEYFKEPPNVSEIAEVPSVPNESEAPERLDMREGVSCEERLAAGGEPREEKNASSSPIVFEPDTAEQQAASPSLVIPQPPLALPPLPVEEPDTSDVYTSRSGSMSPTQMEEAAVEEDASVDGTGDGGSERQHSPSVSLFDSTSAVPASSTDPSSAFPPPLDTTVSSSFTPLPAPKSPESSGAVAILPQEENVETEIGTGNETSEPSEVPSTAREDVSVHSEDERETKPIAPKERGWCILDEVGRLGCAAFTDCTKGEYISLSEEEEDEDLLESGQDRLDSILSLVHTLVASAALATMLKAGWAPHLGAPATGHGSREEAQHKPLRRRGAFGEFFDKLFSIPPHQAHTIRSSRSSLVQSLSASTLFKGFSIIPSSATPAEPLRPPTESPSLCSFKALFDKVETPSGPCYTRVLETSTSPLGVPLPAELALISRDHAEGRSLESRVARIQAIMKSRYLEAHAQYASGVSSPLQVNAESQPTLLGSLPLLQNQLPHEPCAPSFGLVSCLLLWADPALYTGEIDGEGVEVSTTIPVSDAERSLVMLLSHCTQTCGEYSQAEVHLSLNRNRTPVSSVRAAGVMFHSTNISFVGTDASAFNALLRECEALYDDTEEEKADHQRLCRKSGGSSALLTVLVCLRDESVFSDAAMEEHTSDWLRLCDLLRCAATTAVYCAAPTHEEKEEVSNKCFSTSVGNILVLLTCRGADGEGPGECSKLQDVVMKKVRAQWLQYFMDEASKQMSQSSSHELQSDNERYYRKRRRLTDAALQVERFSTWRNDDDAGLSPSHLGSPSVGEPKRQRESEEQWWKHEAELRFPRLNIQTIYTGYSSEEIADGLLDESMNLGLKNGLRMLFA